MQASHKHWLAKFLVGTSALSLMGAAQAAMAQEAPADSSDSVGDEIVVTGIRASLEASADIKRNAQGVVDAISAEDIGKFPDTNLAESLQRISGVSIDRSIGEGSKITVRGVGPDFNLVLLNGRQMPGASIDGSAPSAVDDPNRVLAPQTWAGVYRRCVANHPRRGNGAATAARRHRFCTHKTFG